MIAQPLHSNLLPKSPPCPGDSPQHVLTVAVFCRLVCRRRGERGEAGAVVRWAWWWRLSRCGAHVLPSDAVRHSSEPGGRACAILCSGLMRSYAHDVLILPAEWLEFLPFGPCIEWAERRHSGVSRDTPETRFTWSLWDQHVSRLLTQPWDLSPTAVS